MSMFRDVSDAIDDAHIELRQSIRETIDSLSNDIEGKGINDLVVGVEINNLLSVEVLKTVIKDSVMSPDMQEAVDTIQFVLGMHDHCLKQHLRIFFSSYFREVEGF